MNTFPPPEFSRPQRVDHVPAKGMEVSLEADAEERKRIAERLTIPSIDSLRADVSLKPLARSGFIAVNGRLTARVVQTCGVTLQPVAASLDEPFHMTFAPEDALLEDEAEIELALDEDDPPDPILDGVIDLGEMVVEQLALALDPFPRAEGAVFEPMPEEGVEKPPERPNPFAALAAWKPGKGDGT